MLPRVCGSRAMSGYLQDKQATAEALRGGWVRSGDLAQQDSDGLLWYRGRVKDILVLNSGDTVSPLEVEREILVLPGVEDCIVTGMQERGGVTGSLSEVPWAFIRCSATLDSQRIRMHLQGRISEYKVPRRFVFLADFPLGANGKISRRELGEWAANNYMSSLAQL